MENTVSVQPTNTGGMDGKTVLIVVLVVIILLFTSLGSFTNDFIAELLYSTGTVLGITGDAVKTTATTGLDIANGAVHNGSDLLIKASEEKGHEVSEDEKKFEDEHGASEEGGDVEVEPDNTTNPIQNPISSAKTNWCLVGEYQGKRGCIAISEADKCISGQIYPSQHACLNPNFSHNVLPNMTTPLGVPPRVDLSALPNTQHGIDYDHQLYAEYQIVNAPGNIVHRGYINNSPGMNAPLYAAPPAYAAAEYSVERGPDN
jgi:hypothetical protein